MQQAESDATGKERTGYEEGEGGEDGTEADKMVRQSSGVGDTQARVRTHRKERERKSGDRKEGRIEKQEKLFVVGGLGLLEGWRR